MLVVVVMPVTMVMMLAAVVMVVVAMVMMVVMLVIVEIVMIMAMVVMLVIVSMVNMIMVVMGFIVVVLVAVIVAGRFLYSVLIAVRMVGMAIGVIEMLVPERCVGGNRLLHVGKGQGGKDQAEREGSHLYSKLINDIISTGHRLPVVKALNRCVVMHDRRHDDAQVEDLMGRAL